jgi:hypothetical protein
MVFQLPGSPSPGTEQLHQPQTPQEDKVISKRAGGQRDADPFHDLPDPASLTVSEVMQDAPLTFRQIMADTVRRGISAWDEPDDNFASAFLEFRLRMVQPGRTAR